MIIITRRQRRRRKPRDTFAGRQIAYQLTRFASHKTEALSLKQAARPFQSPASLALCAFVRRRRRDPVAREARAPVCVFE